MAAERSSLSSSARTEMFSDGVFAIAATLLVIEVAVPVGAHSLPHALRQEWPSYVGYVISFLVIGVMWVNHHATFDRVGHIDRPFLFLNLALLGSVAFIPFPTALLAEYIKEGGSNAKWAAFTYSIVLMIASAWFLAMWAYLSRHRDLLTENCEPHAPRVAVRRCAAGVVVYLVTALIALLNAYVATAIFLIVALAFVFAERTLADENRHGLEAGPTPESS